MTPRKTYGSLFRLRALHPHDSALELAAWTYLAALAVVVATSIESWDEWRRVIAVWVGRVVAQRLHATRVRLLDLYAPYGSGSR